MLEHKPGWVGRGDPTIGNRNRYGERVLLAELTQVESLYPSPWFEFGAVSETDNFGDTSLPHFHANPHTYSGGDPRGAGSHASL